MPGLDVDVQSLGQVLGEGVNVVVGSGVGFVDQGAITLEHSDPWVVGGHRGNEGVVFPYVRKASVHPGFKAAWARFVKLAE
jgi:hypothetical protein